MMSVFLLAVVIVLATFELTGAIKKSTDRIEAALLLIAKAIEMGHL